MKIAVIGCTGQLGTNLMTVLGDKAVGLTHNQVRVESLESVRQAFSGINPGMAINTAALHNAGECELDPEKSFLVNALGARNVAMACREAGAVSVYISTDYVFSGLEGKPYNEFDRPSPVNVYGMSKLAGENMTALHNPRHFIVRVSGLFGRKCAGSGKISFIERILIAAATLEPVRVVDDLHFSPTCSLDAAKAIAWLAATELYGTYHITNGGHCSWYDLASEALRLSGLEGNLQPVRSTVFDKVVKRPPYSVLENLHLRLAGGQPLRPWQEALAEYIKGLK